MDNHPIPQDVTGFQFKLIGNMTVKQFAYLAVGVVLAFVFLQLPISFLIKFPLCAFFAILGVGLAFFPVSGRPMDLMIGNFIKALLKPTQFIYEKTGGQLYYPRTGISFSRAAPFQQKDKLKAYLEGQSIRKDKIDEKENNFFMSVSSLASNNVSLQPSINSPLPSVKPAAQPVDQKSQSVQPSPQSPVVKTQTSFLKPMPTPDAPNLITGVTKDPRGNPLSNILVEVKDKEGNPVRAFKTNEVGRFVSATPLINGNYTIEFEDPKGQNKFEKGIVNVSGGIIQPIIAISIDTREELRRSLFSTNN